jgi:hypothetical protein
MKPPPFAATLPHPPAANVLPPVLPPHPINPRNVPPVVNPYAPAKKPVINPYILQKPTNISPQINATAAIQAASAMPANNSYTSAHKPTTLFQNRKVSRLFIFPQTPQAANELIMNHAINVAFCLLWICFVLLLFCLTCTGA